MASNTVNIGHKTRKKDEQNEGRKKKKIITKWATHTPPDTSLVKDNIYDFSANLDLLQQYTLEDYAWVPKSEEIFMERKKRSVGSTMNI